MDYVRERIKARMEILAVKKATTLTFSDQVFVWALGIGILVSWFRVDMVVTIAKAFWQDERSMDLTWLIKSRCLRR